MTTATDTMTVKVRDRRRESNYNYGPDFKYITIRSICPVCGGPRGEPRWLNFCEDGDWYQVNVWDNPCGHQDMYADVLKEAEAQP